MNKQNNIIIKIVMIIPPIMMNKFKSLSCLKNFFNLVLKLDSVLFPLATSFKWIYSLIEFKSLDSTSCLSYL